MSSYVFFSAFLITGLFLMIDTAPPKLKLPTLEEIKAKIEERRELIRSKFTTEAPPEIVPLAPPSLEITTPNPLQHEREKLYINPPEPITPMYNTRTLLTPGDNNDSSFDHDDYKTLTTWLQEIPRGRRIMFLTQNVFRRAMHSFINNDKHTLQGISPGFDRAHHFINTIGKLVLPHPDRLQLTEQVPSLIPEHIFQTKLRNKSGIRNYLFGTNPEEEDEYENDIGDELGEENGLL